MQHQSDPPAQGAPHEALGRGGEGGGAVGAAGEGYIFNCILTSLRTGLLSITKCISPDSDSDSFIQLSCSCRSSCSCNRIAYCVLLAKTENIYSKGAYEGFKFFRSLWHPFPLLFSFCNFSTVPAKRNCQSSLQPTRTNKVKLEREREKESACGISC